MLRVIFLCCLLLVQTPVSATSKSTFITAKIFGQMGNNMFQVAAASALAWDQEAKTYFPDFDSSNPTYQHMFFRVNNQPCPKNISFTWEEPNHAYHKIPFQPNMKIIGYFQSEKYFAKHRKKILQLFAPSPEDQAYMEEKYRWLIDDPNTVGVQIRDYRIDDPTFPQYGRDYLEKTMSLFPKSTLFIVSSNNLEFARQEMPEWVENVFYLENEPHYIDLFLLSKCKHNIITNSTFGWWAAWLNQHENKAVIRPKTWINGIHCQDICPKKWISIDAHYD